MKKICGLILIISAVAVLGASGNKGNDAPPLGQVGRTLIVVNDKASMLTGSTATVRMETTDMPVLFEKTIQVAGGYNYISIWKELHADKTSSAQLAQDCGDYRWGNVFKEAVTKQLAAADVKLVNDPAAQAAVNRARITHPVKFGQPVNISFTPKIFDELFAGGSQYQQWEQAIVTDLKKAAAADNLLVFNLYLWGIRPGGSKIEDQSGQEAQERYFRTGDLAGIFSARTAQTIVVMEARLVKVDNGDLLWSREFSYALSDQGMTADRLLADHAALFKYMSSCLNDWMAENIRLELSGKPLNDQCNCPKPQEL
jgi:hypothetical protein